ncbi:MAG: cation:proton antiporter [Gemmataceae bacterium]|nr:cation:proton antiporter [Gemmataceae bacterium]
MVLAGAALLALVMWWDAWPMASEPERAASSGSRPLGPHTVLHVLLALTAVILAGRALGSLLALLGQPRVIGEMLAGIVLGPSLLGRLSPSAMNFIFAPDAAAPLGVIAQLGVIFYMFLVGVDLHAGRLPEVAGSVASVAVSSMVVPFAAGVALALWLEPPLSRPEVPFLHFALFVGAALAITAFPVLARMIQERKLEETPIGLVALGSAAAADVAAWCILAVIVGLVGGNLDAAWVVLAGAAAFVAAMLWVIRPVLYSLARSLDEGGAAAAAPLVLLGVLASAAATEWIGVHAVFGAFLFGAIIPRDGPLADYLRRGSADFVSVLLLPAFFAFSGLRTQIDLLDSAATWAIGGVVIAVAYASKFGSALLAARATGVSWRDSGGIATLMTTRGLMELIVLNIGLDLGIITPTLFTIMVLMALVTTMLAGPVLSLWIGRPKR